MKVKIFIFLIILILMNILIYFVIPVYAKNKLIETINYHFLYFSFFCVFLTFIFTGKFFLKRKRSYRELEFEKQINELKLRALVAMMNPHFIFNSLNSVQYLINTDKKTEANQYITLMSRLIRMNLDNVNLSFVKLDEELTKLELYLKIEKLRFGNNLSYEIDVGNDFDTNEIRIPNMIIQPFVENSIRHGLIPSDKPGFVKVSFRLENLTINNSRHKFLNIYIIDNGIGYSESINHRKESHTSKGINIIKERLTLLSKELNLPNPLVINDIKKNSPDSQGTEVIISLPPQLYRC
jgi:LytS/YehU family sensor histidine kinase